VKMRKVSRSATWIALLSLFTAVAAAETTERLKKHVAYLASDELEGRLTGSAGEQKAAEYLAAELEAMGARPLPGSSGFILPFDFTGGTEDKGSSLVVQGPEEGDRNMWAGGDLVRALSFSDNGKVTGPVVFAGYGLKVPEGEGMPYNSFAMLDLKDKIVLVLRYSPEEADEDTRPALARYAGLRYKAVVAREAGAKALLVVTGPNSPNAGKTVGMSFDAALSGSGIVAASIGGELGERLFGVVEGTLKEAQSALDTGNPHVSGFDLPGLTLTLDVRVEREKRKGHNVAGYLPAKKGAESRPCVLLGAHYDHLGAGTHGDSLAKKGEAGGIHHGADDNASGVAAVLETGVRLSKRENDAPVALAFFSGEELGLLGSTHFLKDETIDIDRIAAYINMDMVGRMRDNKLTFQGVGSSSVWRGLIEQSNVVVGFDANLTADPYLPTDALIFYETEIPILAFFTGSHEDHHRPSDTPDKLDYDEMARVVDFATLITSKVAALDERPDYLKVERTMAPSGSRSGVRAYTGTIPDYTTEVDGLRLSGVVGGGPADKAGLREGDVIVEFAGRTIANIYDYTYALDSVKVDKDVKVICMRDGKRMEFTITPEARP